MTETGCKLMAWFHSSMSPLLLNSGANLGNTHTPCHYTSHLAIGDEAKSHFFLTPREKTSIVQFKKKQIFF